MSDFKDFHKVKNMLFNVSKLKKGLEEVLKIKNYDSANGIPNFAAICLNQVPGDPASTKGNNARGVFWTKPDESGKEVSRDKPIDENLYTEFVKDFEHTYFKEVYETFGLTKQDMQNDIKDKVSIITLSLKVGLCQLLQLCQV